MLLPFHSIFGGHHRPTNGNKEGCIQILLTEKREFSGRTDVPRHYEGLFIILPNFGLGHKFMTPPETPTIEHEKEVERSLKNGRKC